jgi:hypothetical protein
MFENIFTYYPSNTPQYLKASELKKLFADTWGVQKLKLRVPEEDSDIR